MAGADMAQEPETVAQLWAKCEPALVPPGSGEIQRKQTKRVFYAAFHVACLNLIAATDLGEEQGANFVQAIMDECVAFGVKIAAVQA